MKSLKQPLFWLAVVGPLCATPQLASASCYGQQQQLPAAAVSEFLANPSALFSQSPTTSSLIVRIRDLTASDPATLAPLLQLLATATTDQKNAMGSALAQAAKLCLRNDPKFASTIQQAIADTRDHDL